MTSIAPDERFVCKRTRCEMFVSTCLKRQEMKIRADYPAPFECQGCDQGRALKEKYKGVTIMSKKGICVNCGRGPLILPAHELCFPCYMAQKDKEGDAREEALRAVKEKLCSPRGKKKQKKDRQKRKDFSSGASLPTGRVEEFPTPSAKSPGNGGDPSFKIHITITGNIPGLKQMISDIVAAAGPAA